MMDEATLKLVYTWGVVSLCVPAAVANAVILCSSGLFLGDAEPRAAYMLLGNIALADLATSCIMLLGLVYPHASRTSFHCALLIGNILRFFLTYCKVLLVELITGYFSLFYFFERIL